MGGPLRQPPSSAKTNQRGEVTPWETEQKEWGEKAAQMEAQPTLTLRPGSSAEGVPCQ